MKAKDKKKIKIVAVILAVVAVISAVSIVCSVYAEPIKCTALYYMMPEKIENTFYNGINYEIYKGKNKDYDYKADKGNPLAYYEISYKDDRGVECVLKGDESFFLDDEEVGQLSIAFLMKALEKWESIKSKLIIAAVIVCLIIVVGLIVLWYILWSKKQDKEKEQKYGNKNNNQKKKKK